MIQVVTLLPTHVRLSDFLRELTDGPEKFAERDQIERAVRDLVKVGLLFRCEGLVLPREQHSAFEILEDDIH